MDAVIHVSCIMVHTTSVVYKIESAYKNIWQFLRIHKNDFLQKTG